MAKVIEQYQNTNISDIKIYQLGVQAPPGSMIYFNEDYEHGIRIGSSGIFQTDLDDGILFTSISVTPAEINGVPGKYYIDIIREE